MALQYSAPRAHSTALGTDKTADGAGDAAPARNAKRGIDNSRDEEQERLLAVLKKRNRLSAETLTPAEKTMLDGFTCRPQSAGGLSIRDPGGNVVATMDDQGVNVPYTQPPNRPENNC